MLEVYDNWERLIRATLRREEFRELARAHSRSPSTTSSSSSCTSSSPLHDRDASSSHGESRTDSIQVIYGSSSNSTHRGESGSTIFTMEEICKATKNFSRSFKIGQGGFGTVYKGRLKNGTLVAVKRGNKNDRSQYLVTEFQSEIQTLALVKHRNIVKFYGYLERKNEMIVVVEHVPNGNLRERLDCVHGNVLDFAARLEIAIDVAHAVTYLHMYTGLDHPIIHRDIKSSNVLLTMNLQAKLSDFGLALLAVDSGLGDAPVSTEVKGTAGYLDPEYANTNQLTQKCDVYSFGVLLVELVTGRHPIEPKRELKERITARWAMKEFSDGDAILTLDPRLERSSANIFVMVKVFELALQCLAPQQHNRPTMRECGTILWSIRKDNIELSTSDIPSRTSGKVARSQKIK